MGKLSNLWGKLVSGTVIGILLSVAGLYYELHGNYVHMSMDIATESNVLDVKHPIPDLSILFQGKDIEEEKANLKLLTVRVVNDGAVNIHEDDYDSKMPFGLLLEGGRVVRAQVVGANSPYLGDNIHPQVVGINQVSLDKVIFDKGKFVFIEILVLHPKSTNPQLRPLGKIAGLDEIEVTDSFLDRDQPSFFTQTFNGPAAVQICRVIIYSFCGLIGVIAIGFSIAGIASIPSALRKKKRRRLTKRLPSLDSPEMENKRRAIAEVYIEFGSEGLESAQKLLSDEDVLKRELTARRALRRDRDSFRTREVQERAMLIHESRPSPVTLTPLIKAKLVNLRKDELRVDPDAKRLLEEIRGQLAPSRQ